MTSIQKAQDLILQQTRSYGREYLPLEKTLGRVLAGDIHSDRAYPPFDRAAMDGFALRAADLADGAELHVVYELHAGDFFRGRLGPRECVRIMTGAPVPEDADTVIKKEVARDLGERVSFPGVQPRRGQHIARQGEDAGSGEMLLWKGMQLTAARQAALAALGMAQVSVARLPGVAMYATGSELQPLGAPVAPHQIRDSNSYALRGLLQGYGVSAAVHPPIPDEPALLRRAFARGLEQDLLLISGGVSQGAADHVPGVLAALGVRPLFHRVRIRPGSPLWAGVGPQGTLVLALPGNPVSVQVAFKVFIEPFLRNCLDMPPLRPRHYPLNLPRRARSAFDEFFPAVLHEQDRSLLVHPLPCNGSGDITATMHSEGLSLHPEGVPLLEQGCPVAFYPWSESA